MVEQIEQQQDAPAVAAATLPDGELRWIPIDQLYESPWNPRVYYPEAAMAELVESMRSSGYREWLPLMVRPVRLEGADEAYEIGAGHRRSRAARTVGITVVPCIVREMTDEQFLDVLNFDNTGREDVHPLHEAAGWRNWMEKTGKGVLDIAARIGQSKEYVYQRLKYSSLIDDAKKAFLDGGITAGHAILIARLLAPEQQKALKFCAGPEWNPSQKPGVRELANFIQQSIHLDMERACFDLSSTELVPVAGSCDACHKRTKNSPDLPLILAQQRMEKNSENGTEVAVTDDCTDPSCFAAKVNAHLVQIKARLEAEGAKPLQISSGYGKPKKGCDYSRDQVQAVDRSIKGARAAVVVDGPNVGQVIYVQTYSHVVSFSNGAGSAGSPSKPGKADTAAAAKEEEKRKARVALELSIRRAILAAIRSKVTNVSRVDLEFLVLELLTNSSDQEALSWLHGNPFKQPVYGPALDKAVANLRDQEIFQLAVEIPLLGDVQEWNITAREPQNLLNAAKRYKVDAAKIRKEMEKAAAPPVAEEPAKPAVAVPTPRQRKAQVKKVKKAAVAKATKTTKPAAKQRKAK